MKHQARKRFGQHFLRDRSVLERIVAAVDPKPGEDLLEIGPGQGVLTELLVERVGKLRAIEIDRDLAAGLVRRFGSETLALFVGDALRFDYASIPAGVRVIGNLPYNISTPLLFRLGDFSERFRDLHFMLQKEVVARMAAAHSSADYGRLSVMLQHRFEVQALFDVPPSAFNPRPKVQSSVVRLVPRARDPAGVDEKLLRRVVTAAFSHRRKTLENALQGVLTARAIEALGLDPGTRPENVAPAGYAALARAAAASETDEPPISKA